MLFSLRRQKLSQNSERRDAEFVRAVRSRVNGAAHVRAPTFTSRLEPSHFEGRGSLPGLRLHFPRPEPSLSRPEPSLLRPETSFLRPETSFPRPEASFPRPEASFPRPEASFLWSEAFAPDFRVSRDLLTNPRSG